MLLKNFQDFIKYIFLDNKLIRLLNYSFIIKIKDHVIFYPVFSTFNYFWAFGFMSFCCLIFQIITGFLITMFYSPNVILAFYSIEYFMREFSYGWLIRYFHSNGASIFFIMVYLHIARGIYYKSYNKMLLWITGFILWFLLMGTSFLGYVLPWGQMSYWGCMVITSLVTAIPVAGEYILNGIWGGTKISEITLMRIYSVHFLLPFVLLSLSIYHMLLLHVEGGSSPIGIENFDYISFYPYFIIKDIFALVFILLFIYLYLVFFNPNKLGDSLNYVPADSVKTPVHIVPEWYFLPFYCMLRCIHNKVLGILCMFFSMVAIAILCIFPNSLIPTKFDIIYKYLFTLFVITCMNLEWLATQHMTPFIIEHSRFWTLIYFLYFLFVFINCILEYIMVKTFWE